MANCKLAANNAHLAATDDQSVAETQYDTLAIESAYLAEGQSRRLIEFKLAIKALELLLSQLKEEKEEITKIVKLGSIVQLHDDSRGENWFFITPVAAGFKFSIAEKNFTVITPKSPMAIALINKQVNDEIEVSIGNNKIIDDIIAIY